MKTELTDIIAAYNPNNNHYIHEDDVVGIAEDYAAQFQQEWVDVKDQKPPMDTTILAYLDEDGGQIDTWYYDNSPPDSKILYWQPHPSPPKEK